jgi:hypothetical protein
MLFAMLDDGTGGATVTIPVVMITKEDGTAIRSILSVKNDGVHANINATDSNDSTSDTFIDTFRPFIAGGMESLYLGVLRACSGLDDRWHCELDPAVSEIRCHSSGKGNICVCHCQLSS